MKLRTPGNLQNHLNEEIVWRKRELTALLQRVKLARNHEQSVLLRAAQCMLYAHWEGYCKEAVRAYLNHVFCCGVQRRQLSDVLLAFDLHGLWIQAEQAHNHIRFVNAVVAVRDEDGSSTQLEWDRVRGGDRQMLTFDSFMQLLNLVGGEGRRVEVEGKKHLIDYRLVKNRNQVAHGYQDPIDQSDYEELHDTVIKLLELMKTEAENAVVLRRYERGTRAAEAVAGG